MARSQKLSNGIIIQQDIKNCVRLVLFENESQEYEYTTNGGIASILIYKNKPYGLTCGHVIQGYDPKQLVIADEKFAQKGAKIAGIKNLIIPTNPTGDAQGTDIEDLRLIEFTDDVDLSFFKGSYIIDSETIATSQAGHKLSAAGSLKDKVEIDRPNIQGGYCILEFQDSGPYSPDPFLRHARAKYNAPQFDSITGVSGSPVFDETANRLCGMAMRGGMTGSEAQIYYMDIFDIMKFLKAAHQNATKASYQKT
jgi:hypothetical protein